MSASPPKRSLVSSLFSRKRMKSSFPYPTPSPSPPSPPTTPAQGLIPIDRTNGATANLNTNTSRSIPGNGLPNFTSSVVRTHLIPQQEHQESKTHSLPIPMIASIPSAPPILCSPSPPSPQSKPTPSPSIQRRRRSSFKARGISEAKSFKPEDMKKPPVFSQTQYNKRKGCVSRIPLRPRAIRIATRLQSPEICFTTTNPLYSAVLSHPIRSGKSFTMYYEAQIETTNEDIPCLSLGYVAGKERNFRMPGFEKGSIGIDCRDGRVYLNGIPIPGIKTAPFRPRQRLGLGITFSNKTHDTHKHIELFLTRGGKKLGTWNLQEILGYDCLALEGFDGSRDLYSAVGTQRDVVVNVLFSSKDWSLKF
ncbi:hypothetical protein BGZ60DRAFT_420074 [Tricladium varicosporioides]|nr:hypothetical protein BGZ60DRAFT_420074 [Hymenoscyphus varicosporioides]